MTFERISLALTPARLLPPISAWIAHIPFGMLLVDLLRPKRIVELGTHMGASYAAFCQAAAALKLDTQCTAIDTWRGDAHSGLYGDDVLARLKAHHDPLYGHFSRLQQQTFDEAAATVEAGSVDLLHIDGLHTYEAVRHDLDVWLPKLSPRGVLLLHDTQVREREFGVWRIWAELTERFPTFEFTHAYGLGVAAVGGQIAPGVAEVLQWGRTAGDQVRTLFDQLGLLQVLARDGAALRGTQDREKVQLWQHWVHDALHAAGMSVRALPGNATGSWCQAHLEAIIDAHAPHWRRVSVVVPALNAGAPLEELLAGIKRQNYTGEIDTVVVDSGSTDGTPGRALAAGARVVPLDEQPFNHGAARNLGISESCGDVLLLMSQDATPADDTLIAALVDAFSDPRVAGAYARQIPRPQHDPVTRWRVEHGYAGSAPPRQQQMPAGGASALTSQQQMELCLMDNVCAAVRRCVWEEMPFPRRDFAEDMAWAQQALHAGWTIAYQPAARVVHSHARGMGDLYRRHVAHAAAMRELFGFREITHAYSLPARLLRGITQDIGIVLAAQPGAWRTLLLLAGVPLGVAARLLGTYIGGRSTPPNAAGRPP